MKLLMHATDGSVADEIDDTHPDFALWLEKTPPGWSNGYTWVTSDEQVQAHQPGRHDQQRHAGGSGIGVVPKFWEGGYKAGEGGKASNRWLSVQRDEDKVLARRDVADGVSEFDFKDGTLVVAVIPEKGKNAFRIEWDDKKHKPVDVGAGVTTDIELSRDEHRAIRYYQGSVFHDANGSLRGTREVTGSDLEFTKKQISGIDSAMDRSTVTEDITVMRGGRIPAGDIPAGGTFIDPGFVSTTTDLAVAERFAGAEGQSMMEIRVPAGTPGVFIPSRAAGKTESELLLHRDRKFRYVETRDTGVVVLEVVNDG